MNTSGPWTVDGGAVGVLQIKVNSNTHAGFVLFFHTIYTHVIKHVSVSTTRLLSYEQGDFVETLSRLKNAL